MDREFGDSPFRRMERRKLEAKLGWPAEQTTSGDIEEPIVPQP